MQQLFCFNLFPSRLGAYFLAGLPPGNCTRLGLGRAKRIPQQTAYMRTCSEEDEVEAGMHMLEFKQEAAWQCRVARGPENRPGELSGQRQGAPLPIEEACGTF